MRRGAPGYSFPDFLNLGLAPPPPRGALAVAPRVAFNNPFTLHDYFRTTRAFTPLLLPSYFLPMGPMVQGDPFTPITFTPLIPNPYSPQG